MENHDLDTVRVIRSQPLALPDGRIAIGLWFSNGQGMAIELNPTIVQALQKNLADIAVHLAKKPGSA